VSTKTTSPKRFIIISEPSGKQYYANTFEQALIYLGLIKSVKTSRKDYNRYYQRFKYHNFDFVLNGYGLKWGYFLTINKLK